METYGDHTRAVHLPPPPRVRQTPVGTPVWRTSAFAFESAREYADVLNDREPGYSYSRIDNPTADAFAEGIAALEGAGIDAPVGGQAFASGMAAISAVLLAYTGAGTHVVAATAVYGGTYGLLAELLARFGVETDFVDITDIPAVRAAVRDETRIIWAETLSNPTMTVADLPALAEVAREAGALLVVDSTFATPVVCRPLEHGADLVVHSATKYIGGHSDATGGVVVGRTVGTGRGENPPRGRRSEQGSTVSDAHEASVGIGRGENPPRGRRSEQGSTVSDAHEASVGIGRGENPPRGRRSEQNSTDLLGPVRDIRVHTGGSLAPDEAFLLRRGLETLPLRVRRQCATAAEFAAAVAEHPAVARVDYPGMPDHPGHATARRLYDAGLFGAIVTVTPSGGYDAGMALADHVRLARLATSLGGTHSLVSHVASTTHRQLDEAALEAAGIDPGAVRFSIGLEDAEDLILDVTTALEKASLYGR